MSEQQMKALPWDTTPPWCGYPDPAAPIVGCWSLLDGKIIKREDCDNCECAGSEDAVLAPQETEHGEQQGNDSQRAALAAATHADDVEQAYVVPLALLAHGARAVGASGLETAERGSVGAMSSNTDDLMNTVACLISAMREVGRVPGSSKNDGNDDWWSQEFLAAERALVERGLLLPRAEWEARRAQEVPKPLCAFCGGNCGQCG